MITEFITHLQTSSLRPRVELAFTAEPIEDYSEELPVILVYPLAYGAGDSIADNLVIQNTQMQIACLLGCAIDQYEDLLGELRAAAMGWVLNDGDAHYDAMELEGATIEGLKGGYIWWREVYSVRIRIRQTT